MPPNPSPSPPTNCLSDFDVHVAIDAGNKVRIGGTDSLNLPVAHSQTYNFHPENSPFQATSVLTTYSKVTASPGCTIDVVYDNKISPQSGFHTGVASITAHSDCGAGSCLNFEFLDASYNEAGKCRVKFSDRCGSGTTTLAAPPPPAS